MRLGPLKADGHPAEPPPGAVFRKRVFDLGSLVRDVRELRPITRNVWAVYGRKRIDRAFRERIMVAVAEVNECRFCSYAHHEWAVAAGVDRDELDAQGGLSVSARDPREAIAIAYAQARASADFAPAPDAVERRFQESFTATERRDIETTARVMRIFNLSANTIDALQARRRGMAVPGGRVFDEIVIASLASVLIAIVVSVLSVAKGQSPLQGWRELKAFSARMHDGPGESTQPAANREEHDDHKEAVLR